MEYYAHKNGNIMEPVIDHLRLTGNLCEKYADSFHSGKVGKALGVNHDVGKLTENFQAVLNGQKIHQDHAIIAGMYYMEHGNIDSDFMKKAMSLIMAAHHSYLYIDNSADFKNLFGNHMIPDENFPNKMTRDKKYVALKNKGEYEKICDYIEENNLNTKISKSDYLDIDNMTENGKMFYVRMLFSCLVDADYTATQIFMNEYIPENGRLTTVIYDEFIEKLTLYRNEIVANSEISDINNMRQEVFNACVKAGMRDERFFSLNAPTGTGKTLALMMFALLNARKNGAERIFIILPYLSIINQNGEEYKKIFGKENVLIIDSQEEYNEETRFYAERWDAPIVVTTSVTFFETFFKSEAPALRKLHRVANSVIVFDECQTLPSDELCTTLEILNELTKNYESTVLFSTATKPAYQLRNHKEIKERVILSRKITKIISNMEWKAMEVIPDADSLFHRYKQWKNLQVKWDTSNVYSVGALADYFTGKNQVISIFNTVKHASTMYLELCSRYEKDACFLLTRYYCSMDKIAMIKEINRRLESGEPVYLAATSCVEAGVDFDFPDGAREFAPYDSIVQSAGRICRSKKKGGTFLVFKYIESGKYDYPSPGYHWASDISYELAKQNKELDIYDLDYMVKYYQHLFYSEGYKADKRVLYDAMGDMCFKRVNDNYKLIEEKGQLSIIVKPHVYDPDFDNIVKEIASSDYIIKKSMMRKLEKYVVRMYPNDEHILKSIAVQLFVRVRSEKIQIPWYLLTDESAYGDMGLNIKINDDTLFF